MRLAACYLDQAADTASLFLAEPDTAQKEILSSWALFILIMLLIIALFASYLLQHKKIQAVHETVISIFAGQILSRMS